MDGWCCFDSTALICNVRQRGTVATDAPLANESVTNAMNIGVIIARLP